MDEISPLKRPRGRPRGSTRKMAKLIKDPNAPKRPATAYLLFCQEQREKMKRSYPTLNFSEVTRELGYKWSEMPYEQKKKYIEEAESQRGRYLKEFEEYQKSEAYKQFMKNKFEGENAIQRAPQHLSIPDFQRESGLSASVVDGQFPHSQLEEESMVMGEEGKSEFGSGNNLSISNIFTQEFLDHSKALDEDLKALQQTSTELEESNSLLSHHIDELKANMKGLEHDVREQQEKNNVIEAHLDNLKRNLVSVLQGFPLATFPHPLNTANVMDYMRELKLLWQKDPNSHRHLVQRAKEVIMSTQTL